MAANGQSSSNEKGGIMGEYMYGDSKIDSKRINVMREEIDYLKRMMQRSDSPSSTPLEINNPSSSPGIGTVDHGRLTGLQDDDHSQYFRTDGERIMAGNIDVGNYDITNVNSMALRNAPVVTPAEGMMYWDEEKHVMVVKSDGNAAMQVGLELWDRGHNSSGSLIVDGSVVYPQGIVNGLGDARLAKADSHETARWPLAIATVDIADGENGQVTVFGDVNDIDTSHLSEGPVYLSADTPGAITSISPTHPNIRYLIGFCKKVHPTEGIIFVMPRDHDILSYFNGTFRETFDFLVTSDGATITGTMTRGDANAGNLTMRFSDGETTLDTISTPLTISVTEGSLNSPQNNYFYIPFSTKVIAKSLFGWPSEQHIRIAMVRVADAAYTNDHGPLIVHNWNDHDASIDTGQGHSSHVGQWIRRRQASYETGGDPNGGTISYFTLATSSVLFTDTVAEVWQVHPQIVPLTDMTLGHNALVTNWNGDANHEIADLFEITNDSGGVAITNNRYFNVFIWKVCNKSGEYSQLFINLPSGNYTNLNLCITDSSGFDNNVIPSAYVKASATGYPVARITFQMGTTGWTVQHVIDLKEGFPPGVSGGGGIVTPLTTFSDSDLRIYDNLDVSKQLAFQASGITSGNTRIWTIPDKDMTPAGIDDIADHVSAVDPHGDRAYADGTFVGLIGNETVAGIKTFSSNPIIVNDLNFSGGLGVHRIYNADAGQVISHQHFDGISADIEAFKTSSTQINSYLIHYFSLGMNVTGNIDVTGTVDGVDISSFKTAYDAHIGGNIHIDWTGASAGTIHSTNYVDNDTIYVAGDFAHNSLADLNDGTFYEHITQAQKDALHSIYVLPFTDNSTNWNTAFGWDNHALAGYLTSLGSVTGHSDVTDAGSGIVISSVERTALHARYANSEAISALEGNANSFSSLNTFNLGANITGWIKQLGGGTSGLRLQFNTSYYWDNYRDSGGDLVWEVHQNTTNVEMLRLGTDGSFIHPNNKELKWKDVGGTARRILKLGNDDNVYAYIPDSAIFYIRDDAGASNVVAVSLGKVDIIGDIGASGNILNGSHGHKTKIIITPNDVSTGQSYTDAHPYTYGTKAAVALAYAQDYVVYKIIPQGYKATHVFMDISVDSDITVYEKLSYNSSTWTSKGSGAGQSVINITDITANDTNCIAIHINNNPEGQTSNREFQGGYILIEEV